MEEEENLSIVSPELFIILVQLNEFQFNVCLALPLCTLLPTSQLATYPSTFSSSRRVRTPGMGKIEKP